MSIRSQIAACAALLGLACASTAALADDHAFTDGPVVNVAAVRTEYGKFDDYMKYLDGNWKATQEAAKKAGLVLSYRVITVQPRTENDPDVYLLSLIHIYTSDSVVVLRACPTRGKRSASAGERPGARSLLCSLCRVSRLSLLGLTRGPPPAASERQSTSRWRDAEDTASNGR